MEIEYNVFIQVGEYNIYSHKFMSGKELNSSNKIKESDFPLPEQLHSKKIVWTGNGWDYIDDHTGKTFYNIETKQEKTLELGESLDETLTESKPLENEPFQKFEGGAWVVDEVKKAESEKQRQKTEILAQLNQDLLTGFEYFGNTWTARDRDRSDLTSEILSWEVGADPTPAWRNKNNEFIVMTQEELRGLAKAMKEFYLQKFMESRQAIDALE
jgi:hypothetical protein